ncbi:hypothetical protein DQ04_09771020 [Trypanosoma grayi]|uniref:hypothetical protein n=1 Tax=Trypanosoma grayi TaxID=71804 RepID=UPI0004F44D80|nr:hypothetical protein DQ04_09771020 [Trypanosoma grayi]KEG07449.1 hypothetical protein DQ04_09771020 [Trypanosoma grayi]
MEAIEVRPLSSRELSAAARTADGDGGAYRQPQRKPHTQQGEQQRQQLHVPRGQRDLQRLRDRAEGHVKMASQQRLREEYRRALEILRDIYAALQTTVLQERKQQQQQQEKFLSSTEAVRFERLHQLRDTTNRLTTAHFALLPIEAVLKFLELVGRIVALVQEPHTTAHGYVVRQALRAIFVDGDTVSPAVRSQRHRRGPLLGLHYYKLLHAMLSLPASESIEVLDSTSGVLPVEELCVRRLCCGAGESPPQHFPFLLQIGPARAVRVVAWCLRSPASTGLTAVPGRQERGRGASPLPPRSALRIPFGVGKEYTQSVLAAFAQRPCGGSATATTTARTEAEAATETKLFGVAELATLCSAIVFYEITTMEAVTVLVEAAPMCAAYVEALSGHQLSCVMLAYATLRYHGNLLRHPTPTGTALSAGCSPTRR